MKKTITILVMFIFAVLVGSIPVQAVTATANLNVNKTTVKPGETFTVVLSVTCANEINGIITSYSYDTDKLELISGKAGTNFASLGENNNIELIVSKTGVTTADVYILEFKAKESIKEETSATVSLSNITVSPMTGDDATLNAISTPITIKPETNQGEGNTTPTGGTADTGNTTPTGGTTDTGNTTPTGGTIDTGNTTPTGGTTDVGNTTPSGNTSYNETTNTVRNTNSETNNNTSGKKTSVLPYTGMQPVIIGMIFVISGIAGIMYLSFRKYKNI